MYVHVTVHMLRSAVQLLLAFGRIWIGSTCIGINVSTETMCQTSLANKALQRHSR
jgi:hypothetical protein